MATTKEQRDKAVVLRQAKSSQWVTKAATILGSNVPISKVLDKIDKLVCAVKSLDTKSAECSQSKDRPSILTTVIAPGWGVQVGPVALISLGCTAAASNIDQPGTWDHGWTAWEGRNPGG